MVIPKGRKIQRRKLLPSFCRGLFHTEAKREPGRARIDELKREDYLEHDRQGSENKRTKKGWPAFRTELWRVEENLQTNIIKYLQDRISEFSEKKPLKVLELGCGAGIALKSIKSRYPKKIRTTGTVLGRTRSERYTGVDRLIEGDINQINPRGQYDLIFSSAGSTFYTKLKTTALERVISWLKPEGRAIVEMGHVSKKQLPELKTLFMQNGIKNYKIRTDKIVGSTIFDFVKPAPKLPK